MPTLVAKAVVLALVAGGLLGVATAVEARTDSPAEGLGCRWSSLGGGPIPEQRNVELTGGPLAATAAGATIDLTCTIQLGAANASHDGADACRAASGDQPQVAVVPPAFCSWLMDQEPAFLCTQATVDGTTWYWHVVTPATGEQAGSWSTDSASRCAGVAGREIFPGPLGPALDLVGRLLADHVDPVVCGVLRSLSPGVPDVLDVDSTGDAYVLRELVWDCPAP
jgi:hypothetical protein